MCAAGILVLIVMFSKATLSPIHIPLLFKKKILPHCILQVGRGGGEADMLLSIHGSRWDIILQEI